MGPGVRSVVSSPGMASRDLTARRSGSARRHVRQTRIIAGLAMVVLAGAVASDELANAFWSHHWLLTSLISSLVVVAVSVAVVNEALERRRRRRWSVLAQYVLFELVRTARLTWTGLMYAGEQTQATLNTGARTLLDTPRAFAGMQELLADSERRRQLHGLSERLLGRADDVLVRWAGVMLSAAAYA